MNMACYMGDHDWCVSIFGEADYRTEDKRCDCPCHTEKGKAAIVAYPKHHPVTALANYRAGREVWDTNGDVW